MSKDVLNKRRNKRVSCLVPVEGQEGSVFGEAMTVDFSKGGFGFVAHEQIPLNKKIAIEIELPGEDQSVIVKGKVRWVHTVEGTESYRIGLSFEDVIRGSKTRLNKYFKQLTGRRSAFRY